MTPPCVGYHLPNSVTNVMRRAELMILIKIYIYLDSPLKSLSTLMTCPCSSYVIHAGLFKSAKCIPNGCTKAARG